MSTNLDFICILKNTIVFDRVTIYAGSITKITPRYHEKDFTEQPPEVFCKKRCS